MGVASRRNRQLELSASYDSQHMFVPLEAVHSVDTWHPVCYRNTAHSVFFLLQRTCDNAFPPSFDRPVLWMFHLWSTELGRGGKAVSWSTSKLSGKFSNCSSSVWRAHKPNAGNVVCYYTGVDSLARFVGGACILSECIHHACLSANSPEVSSDVCHYIVHPPPPLNFPRFFQYLMAFHACHGELFIHTRWFYVWTDIQQSFVAQTVKSSLYSRHSPACCCYLGSDMLALFA
jgi:hypothetical protein